MKTRKARETNTLTEDLAHFSLQAIGEGVAFKAAADFALWSLVLAAWACEQGQEAVRPKYIMLDDGWAFFPTEVSK